MMRKTINNKFVSKHISSSLNLNEKTMPGYPIPKEDIIMIRKRYKEKICFSLRFFDRDKKEFNLGKAEQSWYVSLLDVLKHVSKLNKNELFSQRQFYDAHTHDWSKLNYCYNFSDDFFEQIECMQFSVSKSKGRVHGFMIGNYFFVVWLDRHHNLYPDDKYGGLKIYDRPLTCYELLEEENDKLRNENTELLEILETYTSPNKKSG